MKKTKLLFPCVILGGLFAIGCGGGRQLRIEQCRAGEVNTCGCKDGRAGVQMCDATGGFGACVCPPETGCAPGIMAPCFCTDGDRGSQLCDANGTFASCVCAPPACAPDDLAACGCVNGLQGTQLCDAKGTFGSCGCEGDEASHPPVMGVLDFPDPSPNSESHINHGVFWRTGANLGRRFHWDAWVAPRTSGTLVSDGYGSAHALRWGAVLQDGQFVFQGEFWTSQGPIKFSAAEGPAPGEWGYHAIDLLQDAAILAPSVLLYWNGICVGLTSFPAIDRQAGVSGQGDGNLYVMGQLSGGMGGRIAAVRGFENYSPFSQGLPLWAFLPERILNPWIGTNPANFLADYTHPGSVIGDLSPAGYNGGDATAPSPQHPGRIESSIPTSGGSASPHWVRDPESPYNSVAPLPRNTHENVPTPVPGPPGALVFDSFGRHGQNPVWQPVPTLGFTEGGALGARNWMTGIMGATDMPAVFGIINGRAVYLEHQMGIAWVDVQTTEQDVRLDRFNAGWGHGTTGVAFRVVDAQNWGYAFVDQMTAVPPDFPARVYFAMVENGTQKGTAVKIVGPPTDAWTRLRVLAQGDTITAFVDDGRGGWIVIATLTGQTPAPNATGAGLAGAPSYIHAYSLWRGDNFTVCRPGDC